MCLLQLENVTKVFGKNHSQALEQYESGIDRDVVFEQTESLVALHNVSLEVKKGEILVLMGLSGSGKSTLLRCINGLIDPTLGSVKIKDKAMLKSLGSMNRKELRHVRQKRIGMVFQRFALLPWRTVAQNVAFGLELQGFPKAQIDNIVTTQLELVGLTPFKDKVPAALSGGMQQRVGLARALATNPDILLLDEPFSALDPLIRLQMQDELLALRKKINKTFVFVTHDLDEALKVGDRIAILKHGRLVRVATPEELVTHPKTQYERDFVANVNPLSVLSAATVMRPAASLDRPMTNQVILGDQRFKLVLDSAGKVKNFFENGRAGSHYAISNLEAKWHKEAFLSTGPKTKLKPVLKALQRSQKPISILDDSGKFIGVITEQDALRALCLDAGESYRETIKVAPTNVTPLPQPSPAIQMPAPAQSV